MKSIIFAFFMSFVMLSEPSIASASEGSLIVSGSGSEVMKIVKDSLFKAFPGGNIQDSSDSVGYRYAYTSLWSGRHELFVQLHPMVKNGELKISAFKITSGGQVLSFNGQPSWTGSAAKDFNDLSKQIENLSSESNNVHVEKDDGSFIETSAAFTSCTNKIGQDPELVLLAEKTPLVDVNSMSLAMMANTSRPSEEEKSLILKWSEKRDKCLKIQREGASFYPNDPHAPVWFEAVDKGNLAQLDLYEGRLTWGEYNKIRKQNNVDFQSKWSAVNGAIKSDNESKLLEQQKMNIELQKIEAQKRAAAAQEANSMLQNNPFKPAPSNNINCTSTAIGNTVNTNCR